MVEGGVCRRPGPNLSARDGLEGIGSRSGGITSPGSTIFSVCEAIGQILCGLADWHLVWSLDSDFVEQSLSRERLARSYYGRVILRQARLYTFCELRIVKSAASSA